MSWNLFKENKYGDDVILKVYPTFPTVKQIVEQGIPRSTALVLLSKRHSTVGVHHWADSRKLKESFLLEETFQ